MKRFKNLISLDVNTSEVFKKSIPTTFVKVVGMVLAIIVSVFIGRMLGADGLGVINLSNRIVAISLVLCMFGMRQVLIKEIAIGYNKNDFKRIGDSLKTAYFFNVGISIIISFFFVILSPWLAVSLFKVPELEWVLIISFVVFPFQIFTRIFSSGLAGYRKIWQASLVDQTLSVAIVFIILSVYYLLEIQLSIFNVIIAYGCGRFITTLILGIYWNSLFSLELKSERKTKELTKTALPIFLVSLTATIYKNIDIIMIGWLCTAREVGIYAVASRIAILSGFLLNVANSAVAPKFAILYNENKKLELQLLVQYVTVTLFLIALIILAISIAFGNFILSIWGVEFKGGYFVLVVLSVGQFFNVSTGAVGTMLTMTGFEKKLLSANASFMAINIVLNLIFINIWGIEGAALAYAISIFGMNFTRAYYVYKYIGIHIFPWRGIGGMLKSPHN